MSAGRIPSVQNASTLAGTTLATNITNSSLTKIGVTTTNGDILYGTGSGALARLGIGSSAQVLTVASGVPSWAASGSTFSGARVTKSTNQSIANVTFTSITFDQEPLDVGGYHDNSTNNTRLTVPSGKTGYFLVQWNLHPYNITSAAYKLLKNGTSIAQYADSYNWTTGTEVDFTNQWLGALSAGDYVEIQFWQTTGSARNVYGGTGTNEPSWFQITYLGA